MSIYFQMQIAQKRNHCTLSALRQTFSCVSPGPLYQNLCFFWPIFSPHQQAINTTPLNGHILTPKINGVPLSWKRYRAPTGTALLLNTSCESDSRIFYFFGLSAHRISESNLLQYLRSQAALPNLRVLNKWLPSLAYFRL